MTEIYKNVNHINESLNESDEGKRNFSIKYLTYTWTGDDLVDDMDIEASSAKEAIEKFKDNYMASDKEKILGVYDESDIHYDTETGEELEESLKESTEEKSKTISVAFDIFVPESTTEADIDEKLRNMFKSEDIGYIEVHENIDEGCSVKECDMTEDNDSEEDIKVTDEKEKVTLTEEGDKTMVLRYYDIEELGEGETVDDYKDLAGDYGLTVEDAGEGKIKIAGDFDNLVDYFSLLGIDPDSLDIQEEEVEIVTDYEE
jgi:hypothetical protein